MPGRAFARIATALAWRAAMSETPQPPRRGQFPPA